MQTRRADMSRSGRIPSDGARGLGSPFWTGPARSTRPLGAQCRRRVWQYRRRDNLHSVQHARPPLLAPWARRGRDRRTGPSSVPPTSQPRQSASVVDNIRLGSGWVPEEHPDRRRGGGDPSDGARGLDSHRVVSPAPHHRRPTEPDECARGEGSLRAVEPSPLCSRRQTRRPQPGLPAQPWAQSSTQPRTQARSQTLTPSWAQASSAQ